ncbi:MAG: hypothetical protein RML15_00390 [Bacteroidota bacterium]|nr:hypothetical protein [Candidatus Kapabacteria bacterium]MCX7936506.1 hypothetical protein [Chlorobiota bacterium]MDW8074667.1 hypothetical protein [Bacteroidota bacterium]MDW8270857.1 hypothetical protein [Bacteroidota bacterium]
MRSRQILLLLSAGLAVFLWSCSSNSTEPSPPPKAPDSIAIVVNQGTFGQDNASLTRIDFRTGAVDLDWFGAANNGQKLGATANDIALKGDTAFITVTSSKTIEAINIRTGKSVGRITFTGQNEPWRITIVSSTLGVVTTTNGDGIALFDPTAIRLITTVTTGPATEGVAVVGNYAFVANSGYGDLRQGEQHAGTIAVVNLSTRQVERYLPAGPNVREVILSEDGKKLYAFYQHLYSKPDSLQGIIEYDVQTFRELRRWRLRCGGSLQFYRGALYAFDYDPATYSAKNILRFDVSQQNVTPTAIPLPTGVTANGFVINPLNGGFMLFDARDYQSNGRVLMLSSTGQVLQEFRCGVAPVRAVIF